MQVKVFWIGKTRLPGVAALTEEYAKRLGRYCEFQGQELREVLREGKRIAGGFTAAEASLMARSEGSFRVALDPAGRRWSSPELARFLQKRRDGGNRAVAFGVGGAEGFSQSFREKADLLLALSPMTLPHELARVVLLEQLYRAFTLLAGHPYPR
ncbi:MAG: 23S rRNA (pseudouridine(1915)-N(3))-methyltransferase RlmH [Terriglobia bacterium]